MIIIKKNSLLLVKQSSKGIYIHTYGYKCTQVPINPVPFFLLYNTKGDVLQNVQAALF